MWCRPFYFPFFKYFCFPFASADGETDAVDDEIDKTKRVPRMISSGSVNTTTTDDCPICFHPLNQEAVLKCKICSKEIHKKCLQSWYRTMILTRRPVITSAASNTITTTAKVSNLSSTIKIQCPLCMS